jgi:Zn-finger protein
MKVLTVTMDWSCTECEWKHSEPVVEVSLLDLCQGVDSTEAEAQRAAATERMAKAIINHFREHHSHLARTQ